MGRQVAEAGRDAFSGGEYLALSPEYKMAVVCIIAAITVAVMLLIWDMFNDG